MRNGCIMLLLLSLLCTCTTEQKRRDTEQDEAKTTYVIVNDTIPEVRSQVATTPVATYSTDLKEDVLNKGQFAVNVYETKQTFSYLVKVRYKALEVQDTVVVPNFGHYPKVVLEKGAHDLSCIVGFHDKNQIFKPHKEVVVDKGDLRIKVIKQYRTGIYQKAK